MKVIIADDHPVVRQGLRQMLAVEQDLTVVGEARNGQEVVELSRRVPWEVAVLDYNMPGKNGLELIKELRQRYPGRAVLILSMYDNEQFLFEALKAGASGYVLKSGADDDIVTACRAAMRGEPFLYPAAVHALIRDVITRAGERSEELELLTPRELEVLKLIAEGHTSKEIATMLVLSIKTVESHRANILGKLGMRDRVDLTRYAIRRGLILP